MEVGTMEDAYPLSPAQEEMLFQSLYSRQSRVHVQQLVCSLAGDLDVSAFQQAWRRMMERHQVLRTSFHWEDLGEPWQHVHGRATLPIEHQDWRTLPAAEQKARLAGYLQDDRRRGFNMVEAPLMRLALFQTSGAEHQFIWTSHPAIVDSKSQAIVLGEFFDLYRALRQGHDVALLQSPPYGSYVEWLQKQDFSGMENFWRRTLRGLAAPTPLVVDRDQGSPCGGREEDYGMQEIRLPEKLTSGLQCLARQHRLSLDTLVQGAWALLLSRYSGEEEVVFGVTRPCRPSVLEGSDSIVGPLANTLPVKVRVSHEMQLVPWLKELHSQSMAMGRFEHVSLLKVQEWSEILHGTPLFESALNFEAPLSNSNLPPSGSSMVHRNVRLLQSSGYPITVRCCTGPELLLQIQYDRCRFDDATMARMAGHVRTLLEGMASNPEGRLSNLPLLTELERHQLLVEWNNTQADIPRDSCIHQLFEAQVERTPDAIAVTHEGRRLTYGELNERANQLAHYLENRGVGPEVLVGVCMDRSLEMVVGLLGVLKAGGAYVPMDPAYPKERLAFMLEDAHVTLLVTREGLLQRLPDSNARVLCLDRERAAISGESPENPSSEVTPENLAYIVYTSGSTGRPKGALLKHTGLVNLLAHYQSTYQVTPADRASQLLAPAYDSAAWELWSHLTAGASVHIPDEETRASPQRLVEWLTSQAITLSIMPTPMAEAVLAERWPEDLALRFLLTGGEKLHRRPDKRLPFALVNVYGPTEDTVLTTWSQVGPGDETALPPPIGRPLANHQVYVLDHHMQPVPIGVPGELHCAGVGVARGYLNRPELTAEKFVPNPFSNGPAARLYKTGDLVRYLPDGNIEFLGRIDHQVKIRGFRIELGEIETVLLQHHQVREAVVLAREDAPGDKRLVAYVVATKEGAPDKGELRSFLKEKLPDYMTPSAFVILDALPLTPNGKVDRAAVPPPSLERLETAETMLEPTTPMQRLIAQVWCDVLGMDEVGVNDNFFDLGGHSLLAAKAIARLEKLAGLRIEPDEMVLQSLGQLAASFETRMQLLRESGRASLFRRLLNAIRRPRSPNNGGD